MNFTTNPDIDRTHKQGSITASYPALVKTFGQPVVDNGETPYYPCECGDKTQVEWHLEFVDGTIATIYDWKSAVPARLVTRWSIGGHDIDAVMQVKQEMYEKQLRMGYLKSLEDDKFELRQDLVAHCIECFSPDKLDDPIKGVDFGEMYRIVAELITTEKDIVEHLRLRDESVSSSSSSDAGITTVKEFLRRESKDASEEENTH